jgi:hypothetical protein
MALNSYTVEVEALILHPLLRDIIAFKRFPDAPPSKAHLHNLSRTLAAVNGIMAVDA